MYNKWVILMNRMAQLSEGLTETISLHDGLWPRSPLSAFPRTTQQDADTVACGRLQVHQRDGLFVAIN